METIGTFLTRKRTEIGERERRDYPISRAEAARRCDMTYAEYRWMEEKSRNPSPEEINKLSQGLLIPKEEILVALGYCDPISGFVVEELDISQGKWKEIFRIKTLTDMPSTVVLVPSTKKIRIRKLSF